MLREWRHDPPLAKRSSWVRSTRSSSCFSRTHILAPFQKLRETIWPAWKAERYRGPKLNFRTKKCAICPWQKITFTLAALTYIWKKNALAMTEVLRTWNQCCGKQRPVDTVGWGSIALTKVDQFIWTRLVWTYIVHREVLNRCTSKKKEKKWISSEILNYSPHM